MGLGFTDASIGLTCASKLSVKEYIDEEGHIYPCTWWTRIKIIKYSAIISHWRCCGLPPVAHIHLILKALCTGPGLLLSEETTPGWGARVMCWLVKLYMPHNLICHHLGYLIDFKCGSGECSLIHFGGKIALVNCSWFSDLGLWFLTFFYSDSLASILVWCSIGVQLWLHFIISWVTIL